MMIAGRMLAAGWEAGAGAVAPAWADEGQNEEDSLLFAYLVGNFAV